MFSVPPSTRVGKNRQCRSSANKQPWSNSHPMIAQMHETQSCNKYCLRLNIYIYIYSHCQKGCPVQTYQYTNLSITWSTVNAIFQRIQMTKWNKFILKLSALMKHIILFLEVTSLVWMYIYIFFTYIYQDIYIHKAVYFDTCGRTNPVCR